MNCLNGKPIKEEREFAAAEIRTVVVGGSIVEPQKIILSPRVEIHRVIKSPQDEHAQHQLLDHHPPPQVIFTTTSSRTLITPCQNHTTESSHPDQQPLQRVQVIKDGRCFYAEESLTVTPARVIPKDNGMHLNHQHQPMQPQQHNHQRPTYPSSPPPLLVHQPDSKKGILSRQVNVILNLTDDGCPPDALANHGNGQQSLCGNGGNLFRPPVVSSSSTPMRPPPPPPPPRTKVIVSEEPSSSIPDLGKSSNKAQIIRDQNIQINLKWNENLHQISRVYNCV